MKQIGDKPLTNAEKMLRKRQRRQWSYSIMRQIAQRLGYMRNSRDGEGFDRFRAAVDARKITIATTEAGE